ncbi:hypothetical protein [Rhodopirellula bahusiensis]|uniref:hypothetical protein n=1 Tax=Rhodopirellula bahusiensis TaxID=2014065 RepID=UPI003265E5A6
MRKFVLIVAAFSVVFPRDLSACLWDYDTLAMERRLFPGAHELIAGYFVRHSDAYYEWRITDRMSKPAEQLSPSDLDDIAVAYDKLGHHEKAIETILKKIERWPDQGRYESEANLGTFHIHAGHLQTGLEHIEKAIAINSDAHFGREIYQQLLIEYLIEKRSSSEDLPLSTAVGEGRIGFTAFVLNSRYPPDESTLEEIQKAAKGVMGMMRFGNEDSPVLLESLGDLLLADYHNDDSKMLATRAFLRASMEVEDPAAKTGYRERAKWTIAMQNDVELEDIEEQLMAEVEQANALSQQILDDEKSWISAGLDVDAEFEKKYFEAPTPSFNSKGEVSVGMSTTGVVICVSSLVTGLLSIAMLARKRKHQNVSAM